MIACIPWCVLIMSFLLSTTVYIKAIINTALSKLITSITSIMIYNFYEHFDFKFITMDVVIIMVSSTIALYYNCICYIMLLMVYNYNLNLIIVNFG